ncbi:cytochrome c oxidase subunit 5B, mitochondrial-like [Bacillus rossius redtenbacheri]|uniref:cytochrome c oxidase subunit 5B, mitochondrial-like n=1 Tax=Bacillus rossius redtenbacheri TaxID=93214 RepID=UPI002FDDC6D9
MAFLCRRVVQLSCRNFSISSVQCAKKLMGDPMELATGLEKRELLAELAGNDDPFNMKLMKRGPGTKENPNLIPSAFDARIIGCICEPEAQHIKWMWLHKGEPKRCSCGSWYKLQETTPI